MPQEQDLDLLLPLRAEPQRDKLKQPPQRPVHEREDTPRTTRHRHRPYSSADHDAEAPNPSCRHPQVLDRERGALDVWHVVAPQAGVVARCAEVAAWPAPGVSG